MIVAGPEHFYARAPDWIALSAPVATKEEAGVICDQMMDLFEKCPPHQRGAAAQAAMSLRAT